MKTCWLASVIVLVLLSACTGMVPLPATISTPTPTLTPTPADSPT